MERGSGNEVSIRCRWCRHVIAPAAGRGRPREFCSQRCRQWDWVARQRAADLQLSEGELVVTRDQLDALKDAVFVLECAVNDVRQDLTSGRHTKDSLTELLNWLLESADPVIGASVSPQ